MQEFKSIEQLENDYWKNIEFSSGLVEKCHAYRKIPIKDLSVEQLRLLVGQKIGLPFIIPKVIAVLNDNILAEGDLYPGDLLSVVLDLTEREWPEPTVNRPIFLGMLKNNLPEIETEACQKLIWKVQASIS